MKEAYPATHPSLTWIDSGDHATGSWVTDDGWVERDSKNLLSFCIKSQLKKVKISYVDSLNYIA